MILTRKNQWIFVSLVTIFYPVIAIFVGTSFATVVPLFLSWIFNSIFIFSGSVSISFSRLLFFIFFPILFASSLINSSPLMVLASIKTYTFLPSFLAFIFLALRGFNYNSIIKLIDRFFCTTLFVCIFSALEIFSRIIPFVSPLLTSYFSLTNASGLEYLNHGAVTGIFEGSNTLGFYGDLHTSAGLSVITFFYFAYRKKYSYLFFAFVALSCTLSTTALFTALIAALLLVISRSSIINIFQSFFALIVSLTVFEITFTGHLAGKLFGNSFSTISDHFINGLTSLQLFDLLFGRGYASEGVTVFKESFFVESIYMSGILVHIIPVSLILISTLIAYNLHLTSLHRCSLSSATPPIGRKQFFFYSLSLLFIYFGCVFHYNQFFNPVVTFAFSILVLLPYFTYSNLYALRDD